MELGIPVPERAARGDRCLRGHAAGRRPAVRPRSAAQRNNSVLISGPADTVAASATGWELDDFATAAAYAAATVALIKERYPALRPALVARALAMSARYRPHGGYAPSVGFGVLDPYDAVIDAGRLAASTVTAAGGQGAVAAGTRFGGGPPGPVSAMPPAGPLPALFWALLGVGAVLLVTVAALSARRLRKRSQDQRGGGSRQVVPAYAGQPALAQPDPWAAYQAPPATNPAPPAPGLGAASAVGPGAARALGPGAASAVGPGAAAGRPASSGRLGGPAMSAVTATAGRRPLPFWIMIGLILLLGLGAAAGGAAGVVATATRHPSAGADLRRGAARVRGPVAATERRADLPVLGLLPELVRRTDHGHAGRHRPAGAMRQHGGRRGRARPGGGRLRDRAARHVYRRLADRGGDDRDRGAAQPGRRAQSAEHLRGGRPRRAAWARLSRHRGELVHRQRPRDLRREDHRWALPLPLRRRLRGRPGAPPCR